MSYAISVHINYDNYVILQFQQLENFQNECLHNQDLNVVVAVYKYYRCSALHSIIYIYIYIYKYLQAYQLTSVL